MNQTPEQSFDTQVTTGSIETSYGQDFAAVQSWLETLPSSIQASHASMSNTRLLSSRLRTDFSEEDLSEEHTVAYLSGLQEGLIATAVAAMEGEIALLVNRILLAENNAGLDDHGRLKCRASG